MQFMERPGHLSGNGIRKDIKQNKMRKEKKKWSGKVKN